MSRLIVKNLPNGVSGSRGWGPEVEAEVREWSVKDGGVLSQGQDWGGPEPKEAPVLTAKQAGKWLPSIPRILPCCAGQFGSV